MTTQLQYEDQIASIINKTLPLTWSWIAGFFQAEGSTTYSQGAVRSQIGQKNREILDRIQEFLGFGKVYDQKVNHGFKNGLYYSFQFNKRSEAEAFYTEVSPHLVGDKKYKAELECEAVNLVLPRDQAPLDWDYTVGFWEGDGYTSSSRNRSRLYVQTVFTQKDTEILHLLKDFLGKGSIQPTRKESGISKLVTSDLRAQLLKYARTHERRKQLALSLAESNRLEGVEGYASGYQKNPRLALIREILAEREAQEVS